MTIDLCSITFNLVEDIYLLVVAEEHLNIHECWLENEATREEGHTIMALT